jgi:ribosomal-protein-alanine N-acetyltransferase
MIRPAAAGDLTAMEKIELRSFDDPWGWKDFAYELGENPYAELWVDQRDDGTLTGFYDLWILFERAELANLAVDPQYRRQGIGEALMAHMEARAKSQGCETISLEVRRDNTAALELYRRRGYLAVATRKDYYVTPTGRMDAYLLEKGI